MVSVVALVTVASKLKTGQEKRQLFLNGGWPLVQHPWTARLTVGDSPCHYPLAPEEKGLLLMDLILQAAPSLCHFQRINYLGPGEAL